MKAISKVVLATLIGGLLTFGVGCGPEGLPAGKSAEDVIKEALLNQKEIKQAIFEFSINADIKGDVDGEKNELKGTLKVSGSSNTEKEENQFNLYLDGKMNADSAKANLETRAMKDGVFIKLAELSISEPQIQAMLDMYTADYKGKWTKLSFAKPTDTDVKGMATIQYSEGDPLFLKDIQYTGTRDVLGLKSFVFKGTLDKEVFMDSMDAAQAEQVEMFFEKGDISAEVYTAVNEKVFTGMSLNLKLSDKEMNGTASLVFLMNSTKSNKVEAPKYDKEITEDDLMNMLAPSLGAEGTEFPAEGDMVLPGDTTDFDAINLPAGTGEEMTEEELNALMESLEAVQ